MPRLFLHILLACLPVAIFALQTVAVASPPQRPKAAVPSWPVPAPVVATPEEDQVIDKNSGTDADDRALSESQLKTGDVPCYKHARRCR